MQNLGNKKHGWSCSTLGRKQLIGLTGVGLSLFMMIHMLENMLILVGPQAYNNYTHFLTSNPLIYLAEAGLVALFLGHIFLASAISIKNWGARTTSYAVTASGAKATSLTQRTLWAQGLLILVFLILHLITFKYGTEYSVNYGQGEIRDLHRLVIEVFKTPIYIGWYLVALVVLGFHLSHGVGSAFQTMGLHHVRYQGLIRKFSLLYAVVVAGGFIVQPLYVFFIHRG
jgi:succinate dehydrogenase / fumarate reductase, cytochrome b subunit